MTGNITFLSPITSSRIQPHRPPLLYKEKTRFDNDNNKGEWNVNAFTAFENDIMAKAGQGSSQQTAMYLLLSPVAEV